MWPAGPRRYSHGSISGTLHDLPVCYLRSMSCASCTRSISSHSEGIYFRRIKMMLSLLSPSTSTAWPHEWCSKNLSPSSKASISAVLLVVALPPYQQPSPPMHSPLSEKIEYPPLPYLCLGLHPPSKNRHMPLSFDSGVQDGAFFGRTMAISPVFFHILHVTCLYGGSGAGISSSFSSCMTFKAPAPAPNLQRYCNSSTNLVCKQGGSSFDYAQMVSSTRGMTMVSSGRYST